MAAIANTVNTIAVIPQMYSISPVDHQHGLTEFLDTANYFEEAVDLPFSLQALASALQKITAGEKAFIRAACEEEKTDLQKCLETLGHIILIILTFGAHGINLYEQRQQNQQKVIKVIAVYQALLTNVLRAQPDPQGKYAFDIKVGKQRFTVADQDGLNNGICVMQHHAGEEMAVIIPNMTLTNLQMRLKERYAIHYAALIVAALSAVSSIKGKFSLEASVCLARLYGEYHKNLSEDQQVDIVNKVLQPDQLGWLEKHNNRCCLLSRVANASNPDAHLLKTLSELLPAVPDPEKVLASLVNHENNHLA